MLAMPSLIQPLEEEYMHLRSYGADICSHTCIWSSGGVVCTITLREWCPVPIRTGDSYLDGWEIPFITLEGHTSPFRKVSQSTIGEKYERVTFLCNEGEN